MRGAHSAYCQSAGFLIEFSSKSAVCYTLLNTASVVWNPSFVFPYYSVVLLSLAFVVCQMTLHLDMLYTLHIEEPDNTVCEYV